MTKPVILITSGKTEVKDWAPNTAVPQTYIRAVLQAGGIPLVVPLGVTEPDDIRQLVSLVDGIILTGGPDVDPAIFGGKPHPTVYGVNPERDSLEIELINQSLATDKPVLGICRGCQVMNVALGGTLYTHIPDQLPRAVNHDQHDHPEHGGDHHLVFLTAGTKLQSILQESETGVNTFHHQGIEQLGKNLVGTSQASDGLIESIELPEHPFFVGVQWHPEWMTHKPEMRRIFENFVNACGEK
ncbi:MAG TPA: gamma-glutamyl-gamma-aminobutyrate hydrolase family protein [Bellilinea sp.]|nr:gamma-glutamyl-gamma-aminobutyrate hydrolase family protein [Bellilinea sp.]